MIDENELIKLIESHKRATVGDKKSVVNEVYSMAHDHIIEIVKILADFTKDRERKKGLKNDGAK